MSFKDHIRQQIHHNGPMDVGTFMGLAVGHYYNSRDPFGTDGDFTTAPEISQMFGELLGAWVCDLWMQRGQPERFVWAECGPGRGTLMADALRATAKVPGFHKAAQVHLVEMSGVLKEKQVQKLAGHDVRWCTQIEDLPDDMPMILLGNEFLDALPVRQFIFDGQAWGERVVGLEGEAFCFGFVPLAEDIKRVLPREAEAGAVFEWAPARDMIVRQLMQRPDTTVLFIDYGFTEGHGDTLQAMRRHGFVDVLDNPGEDDLTSHVDFAAVKRSAGDAQVFGPVTQAHFLQGLGLGTRAAMLRQHASPEQGQDIDAALRRLTAPEEMGTLFKVIALSNMDGLTPAGF
ncbi:MAG: SAM-dependent methyltransferase [Rhodospirillales bacterium]|nr:SAM-dependent methyltransferase [Rhodospirillales bacterium]MCB9995439.1 SAM-dependent methyltransferase [Rhodospirillales bacterium]